MRQSKIALRLLLYFSAALLLFALVVGAAFTALSAKHTMDLHREHLQQSAENIAETMYGFLSGTAPSMGGGGMGRGQGQNGHTMQGTGFGAYLRYLDDFAVADVWVVDGNSKAVTPGYGHTGEDIVYEELPPDGEAVIDRALGGEVAFSQEFSGFLGKQTLSVAVPVRRDQNSQSIGAVLLHTPVQDISDAVTESLGTLLLSLLAALAVAVPAGLLLSLKFTKPLKTMQATAVKIAQGDFSAQNRLAQRDEIGDLARAMDGMALDLGKAAQESQRLEQTRRDFLSNISHELRTPVTVLRGSLEALADGVVTDPEQVAEYRAQMLAESKHLQRLVDDLLELSRLENPDFAIESAPLDLRQLVEDVARSMRRVAQPKNVRLEPAWDRDSYPVTGDYGRLRQMLLAVTDNAVKFSPAGEPVSIELSQEDGRPVLSVTDRGPGIPPNQQPLIFHRFHTGGGEQNPTGTGLGLPIVGQIALRHHIEIQVESRPGHTRFSFRFPPV